MAEIRGQSMLPSQASAPDIESARAVILVIVVVGAVFWKEILRVLLALIVVAVGVGAFVLLHGMH
jgi:hypothetical protein